MTGIVLGRFERSRASILRTERIREKWHSMRDLLSQRKWPTRRRSGLMGASINANSTLAVKKMNTYLRFAIYRSI